MEKIEELKDDGLITPEVGEWSEEKYKLIAYYSEMFSTSMKNKWDCRVYIDLFAGAGRAKLKTSKRIVKSSPLIALSITDKFDKYIFCENDSEKISALKERIKNEHSDVDTKCIEGDVLTYSPKIEALVIGKEW
jgi:three-Cys-motif partner protein